MKFDICYIMSGDSKLVTIIFDYDTYEISYVMNRGGIEKIISYTPLMLTIAEKPLGYDGTYYIVDVKSEEWETIYYMVPIRQFMICVIGQLLRQPVLQEFKRGYLLKNVIM